MPVINNTKVTASQFIQKSNNKADKTKLVRTLVKLEEQGFEKLANIVNMAGKAIVAPAVIIMNPLVSKDDKEDRKYTACKQPIEAIIMGASQLFMLSFLEKKLDNLSKKGKLWDEYNIKNKCSDKLEESLKRLNILKDRLGFIFVLATIPILTKISNYIYPKIMNIIMPQKDDLNLSKQKE